MSRHTVDASLIDEIRQRADIIEIVGQHVTLKRSGTSYKGLCPFHGEKTPSFHVNPDKQSFYCFGCQVGGDVFKFLELYHNQTFGEVLRELARQYGVPLTYQSEQTDQERLRESLLKLNRLAMGYFERMLLHPAQGESARAYLQTRGITAEMQQRFHIGYAPNGWTHLYDYMRSQGFTEDVLLQSGLLRKFDGKDGCYDFFRHRLMFPILNLQDEVVAFGGRTLEADNQAKYINSPDTPVYTKGHHIFALNLAKKAIRQRDQILLMEGYLDVITAHQFGFEQAVAGLGTALTPQQARHLLRFSDSHRVVMAYDADAAGQKATDRAYAVLVESTQGVDVRVQVLQIPEGKDPDVFLHKYGAEAFQQLVDHAQPIVEYQIQKILASHDLTNGVTKAMAARACLSILLAIPDAVYRDESIRWTAQQLDVREDALREQLIQEQRRLKSQQRSQYRAQQATQPASAAVSPAPMQDKQRWSELGLLYLMIEYPEGRDQIARELSAILFDDPLSERLRVYLLQCHGVNVMPTWEDLFKLFPESESHQRLAEILESPFLKGIDFEKSLADFVRNVKLKSLHLQMEQLGEQIRHAEAARDQETYMQLMRQYIELTRMHTRLKDAPTV